uniref:Uncharacterized protein n=1 Tax=Quercus lobata TaxID=97700 RepID=A0A7N2LQJ2_QUELO
MKSRILITYPVAFPADSTEEVVDRRPGLEMPNISQAVHKLQHVSWVPLGKHNFATGLGFCSQKPCFSTLLSLLSGSGVLFIRKEDMMQIGRLYQRPLRVVKAADASLIPRAAFKFSLILTSEMGIPVSSY